MVIAWCSRNVTCLLSSTVYISNTGESTAVEWIVLCVRTITSQKQQGSRLELRKKNWWRRPSVNPILPSVMQKDKLKDVRCGGHWKRKIERKTSGHYSDYRFVDLGKHMQVKSQIISQLWGKLHQKSALVPQNPRLDQELPRTGQEMLVDMTQSIIIYSDSISSPESSGQVFQTLGTSMQLSMVNLFAKCNIHTTSCALHRSSSALDLVGNHHLNWLLFNACCRAKKNFDAPAVIFQSFWQCDKILT